MAAVAMPAIRVAIVGDGLLRAELIDQMLRQRLAPVARRLDISRIEVGWPDRPLIGDAELNEFVGDPEQIAGFARHAHVVITQVGPIGRRLLEDASNLQIIAVGRGGPVNVNIHAATARGVPVVNAPGANAQAVIEFTLALILAETKSIARAHGSLVRGIWRGDLYRYEKAPRELQGQTVGLIGFGAIGRGLIPYLRPFGLRVLVFDPYVPAERLAALGVEPADLSSLLAASDIVSMHARVTAETTAMMGAAEFAQMKPGAYFINTARGPLVDYEALYAALAGGHLGGAALDTFAVEPPPADWPLLTLENVTVTPHIAGSSRETALRKIETVVEDVANFYAGRPLLHCVNPAVLTSA